MRIFLISDTHFWHRNIIDYSNRPFADVEAMNEAMVANWNRVVTPDDLVYHLGDVCFAGKLTTEGIVRRLHGRKHLLLGNHDRGRKPTWWQEVGFDWVSEHPIILSADGAKKPHDERFIILSHEPMFLNQHLPYLNIHGHIHQELLVGYQYINVSVEHTNYAPVALSTLMERFKQPDLEATDEGADKHG